MRNVIFDMAGMHQHGALLYEYLRLRKHFLVDGLGWNIPHNDDVEMDQYDTPNAIYSVVVSDGRVVGGARTQSSGAVWGNYTCMLKDAALGRLHSIPRDIFDPTMCRDDLWECTRLVVSDELRSVRQRTQCIALAIDGLIRAIVQNGGREMMSFSPLPLQRTFHLIGVDAHLISTPYTCACDGREYAVFHAEVARPVNRLRELGIDTVRNAVEAAPAAAV